MRLDRSSRDKTCSRHPPSRNFFPLAGRKHRRSLASDFAGCKHTWESRGCDPIAVMSSASCHRSCHHCCCHVVAVAKGDACAAASVVLYEMWRECRVTGVLHFLVSVSPNMATFDTNFFVTVHGHSELSIRPLIRRPRKQEIKQSFVPSPLWHHEYSRGFATRGLATRRWRLYHYFSTRFYACTDRLPRGLSAPYRRLVNCFMTAIRV